MAEVKARLEELHMEHEYQLRLKVMSFNEKIRELSDKSRQQAEAAQATQQVRAVLRPGPRHADRPSLWPVDHEDPDGRAGARAPAELGGGGGEAPEGLEGLG